MLVIRDAPQIANCSSLIRSITEDDLLTCKKTELL